MLVIIVRDFNQLQVAYITVARVRRARVPLVCHALKFAHIWDNPVRHASTLPRFFNISISLVCPASSLPPSEFATLFGTKFATPLV